MAKVIFSIGLSRSVVQSKWDGFLDAFSGFEPEKVARLTARNIERMMKDDRLIRNHAKIFAIVQNAKAFVVIRKESGSFQQYLKSLSGQGEVVLCKLLSKRFSFLGGRTVVFFLRSVERNCPRP